MAFVNDGDYPISGAQYGLNATVYQGGTTLTWPNVAAGQPGNVITEGQTVDVSGHGSALVLLGASNNGTGTGDLTVTYTDGSTQTQPISFADWYTTPRPPATAWWRPRCTGTPARDRARSR
ncbi:MAG: hypothetical protein ABSF03_21530 [Streptosporangiaceae bacterium]